METLKRCFVISLFGCFVISLFGCASVKETARGVAGISTKTLEEARKDALTKTFPLDYNTCHARTRAILRGMGSYTYAENPKKNMIAIYVSQQDTTPVGIFFKAIDSNNTQVEISSVSTPAKELIATQLFAGLEERTLEPKLKEKAMENALKETEADSP